MILKERGDLDLDRPINDYLGESKLKAWVGSSDEATVCRVANHSAGLPLHFHFFFEDEPYANLGYGILGYVISRLSGKGYPDFMREEVFLPLGMTHTSLYVSSYLEKYRAVGYGADGLPIPSVLRDTPGAGAVYSSAHDLVRFGLFHLKAHIPDQKTILSDETIDEMQQPTNKLAPFREGQGYGMGWFIEENQMGYRSIYHVGGIPGISTRLTLIPSEELVVVTLSNAESRIPVEITHEIFSVLLPEYAKNRAQLEAKQKEEQAKAQEPAPASNHLPSFLGGGVGVSTPTRERFPLPSGSKRRVIFTPS